MQTYRDVDRDSGVEAFELTPNSIIVKFKGSARTYEYSHASAGVANVDEMKRLALSGDGLHSYINRRARLNYVR